MTEDTEPKPQRFQPRSRSPMADPAVQPAAPRQAKSKKKKHAPSRPATKPVPAVRQREAMTAPSETDLDAMRPPEEHVAEESEAPEKRKSGRVPFGTQEAKMAVPEREGFTRRWFNDTPGRISKARRAGYEHVIDDLTKRPMELTVTKSGSVAGGMKAFCMEILNEFYDEDFAKKQEALDIVDMQIQKGTHKQESGDARYVPPNTIKFGVTRGLGK